MKKVILSQKQRNIENKIDLGYISYYNNDDKKEWTSKVEFIERSSNFAWKSSGYRAIFSAPAALTLAAKVVSGEKSP